MELGIWPQSLIPGPPPTFPGWAGPKTTMALGSEAEPGFKATGEGTEAGRGAGLLYWALGILSLLHTDLSLLMSPPGFSRAAW